MSDKLTVGGINSETALVDFLDQGLSSHGWHTDREVSPKGYDYRVDLIASHEVFGRIGIEAKHITKAGGGGKKIARAHEQITRQYWDKEYSGEKILLWAVCPFFSRLYGKIGEGQKKSIWAYEKLTAEIFRHYGVGFVSITEQYANIRYGHGPITDSIPLFPIERDLPEVDEHDVAEIREKVKDKRISVLMNNE